MSANTGRNIPNKMEGRRAVTTSAVVKQHELTSESTPSNVYKKNLLKLLRDPEPPEVGMLLYMLTLVCYQPPCAINTY